MVIDSVLCEVESRLVLFACLPSYLKNINNIAHDKKCCIISGNILISFYRYAAAGGITGALYKFKQGPRATIAGCIIGSALGSLAGSVSLGIMYLTGMLCTIHKEILRQKVNTQRRIRNQTRMTIYVYKCMFYLFQELPWKKYDTGNTNGRKNIRRKN